MPFLWFIGIVKWLAHSLSLNIDPLALKVSVISGFTTVSAILHLP